MEWDAKAKKAMLAAKTEASRLGSDSVLPEHILLGLLRVDEPVKVVLSQFGAIEEIRGRTISAIQPQVKEEKKTSNPSLSDKFKLVLRAAAYEAASMMDQAVTGEHLLIALAKTSNSLVPGILREYGMSAENLRAAMLASRGASTFDLKGGDITIAWDPEIVSEQDYVSLVLALGDLVRASGGLGIIRSGTTRVGVTSNRGVLV